MRRFGLLTFALVLAMAAIQVPACEHDPSSGKPQDPLRVTNLRGGDAPAAQPAG